MNVLAKPQLENTILLDELIDIMENLGIPDDEGEIETGAQQMNIQQDSPEPPSSTKKPQDGGQKKKKGVDVTSLSESAQTLLYNFMMHLEQESMTVSNFFEGVKYEQMVKTKKKESTVDIVPAEDFFRLLKEQHEILEDVDLSDDVQDELKDLL